MGRLRAQNFMKTAFIWKFVLIIWVTGCEQLSPSLAESCGIQRSTNDECQVLTCAIEDECSSIEDAVDCCFKQFGYGVEDNYLPYLLDDCNGDDCDPAKHISSQTAICIAQTHGLESGVGWCGGAFINNNPNFYWSIINTTEEIECTEDTDFGHKGGFEIFINSKTGEIASNGTTLVYLTVDCQNQ
jgi:hypothetical protein